MSIRKPRLELELPAPIGWGGAREGAGRKPVGPEPGISHRREVRTDARDPVHVTVRVRDHVWNLRSRRCYAVFAVALRGVRERRDFRVVHFSVQGNHVHAIVEADDASALARGMKALLARLGKGLNALMGRCGKVFRDRYHAHVLRTPAEVRRALAYVLGNFASHAVRRGDALPRAFVDPYSSAVALGPDGERPPVSEPASWLFRTRGLVLREPEAIYEAAA
jgi:REP-associated tyrosine transposase